MAPTYGDDKYLGYRLCRMVTSLPDMENYCFQYCNNQIRKIMFPTAARALCQRLRLTKPVVNSRTGVGGRFRMWCRHTNISSHSL